MRKIEANAFNGKIIAKIKELDALVRSIGPENVNSFDADIIEAAENYTKVLMDCSWEPHSNFNGIEMHKVIDMIKCLKGGKKSIYVQREMLRIQTFNTDLATGTVKINVPDKFDGRLSFVFPKLRTKKDGAIIVINPLEQASVKETGKLIARKNKSSIDIDVALTFEVTYNDTLWVDVFYILWR